jgi:hypothetical protein
MGNKVPNNLANSILALPERLYKIFRFEFVLLVEGLLDSFINFKIKILKIEGEGAEPEIIYGYKEILNNIHYISADLGPERGFAQENTIAPVVNFLLKNNFVVVDKSLKRDIYLFRNLRYK